MSAVNSAHPGVLGGGPGARNVFRYEQDDGYYPPTTNFQDGRDQNHEGDQHLRLETPGWGAGMAPQIKGTPKAVARDVSLGYVTAARAETDYLVRLDAHGDPDIPATQRLRKAAQP